MIYLATPYSHPNPQVRESRVEGVTFIAGVYWRKRIAVFSPITHIYPIKRMNGTEGDSLPIIDPHLSLEMRFDLHILSVCGSLYCVKFDGWVTSVGVSIELDFASRVGIPITYIDPESFGLNRLFPHVPEELRRRYDV